MKGEKRFYIYIKKSLSGFFTIDGRKVRTPVRFVAMESQIPLIKSRMRLESITEYDISPIINDNEKTSIKI